MWAVKRALNGTKAAVQRIEAKVDTQGEQLTEVRVDVAQIKGQMKGRAATGTKRS
jgi:hypothetical protein